MLIRLSENIFIEIFNYLGAYDLTFSLIIVSKYLRNNVLNYASLKLKKSFDLDYLHKVGYYHNEVYYGRESISQIWLLQFISIPRLIFVGGSKDSRRIDILDLSTGKWRQGGGLSMKREKNYSLVQHNNNLFAISGDLDQSIRSIEKYDVLMNYWTPIISLPDPISTSASVSYDNKILIIGGEYKPSYSRTNKVFALVNEESWQEFPSLNRSRSGHAAIIYGTKIYVAGGSLAGSTFPDIGSSHVEYYDATTCSWVEHVAMNIKRVNFDLLVIKDKLYAVGGDSNSQLDTIESFDGEAWKIITQFPCKRSYSSVFNIGSMIFIVGGKVSRDTPSNCDVFCTSSNQWLDSNIMYSTKMKTKEERGVINISFPKSFPNMVNRKVIAYNYTGFHWV